MCTNGATLMPHEKPSMPDTVHFFILSDWKVSRLLPDKFSLQIPAIDTSTSNITSARYQVIISLFLLSVRKCLYTYLATLVYTRQFHHLYHNPYDNIQLFDQKLCLPGMGWSIDLSYTDVKHAMLDVAQSLIGSAKLTSQSNFL